MAKPYHRVIVLMSDLLYQEKTLVRKPAFDPEWLYHLPNRTRALREVTCLFKL